MCGQQLLATMMIVVNGGEGEGGDVWIDGEEHKVSVKVQSAKRRILLTLLLASTQIFPLPKCLFSLALRLWHALSLSLAFEHSNTHSITNSYAFVFHFCPNWIQISRGTSKPDSGNDTANSHTAYRTLLPPGRYSPPPFPEQVLSINLAHQIQGSKWTDHFSLPSLSLSLQFLTFDSIHSTLHLCHRPTR